MALDRRVRDFAELVARLGAEAVWLDSDAHDRAVAVISHLPQLLAVASRGCRGKRPDETGYPH